jgi:hypothetical protein
LSSTRGASGTGREAVEEGDDLVAAEDGGEMVGPWGPLEADEIGHVEAEDAAQQGNAADGPPGRARGCALARC